MQVKEEGWWIVLGNPVTDELYALKRTSFGQRASFKLDFQAAGYEMQNVTLYVMCDSYLGMDQEYRLVSQ